MIIKFKNGRKRIVKVVIEECIICNENIGLSFFDIVGVGFLNYFSNSIFEGKIVRGN